MDNRAYDIIKMVSLLAVPILAFIGAFYLDFSQNVNKWHKTA